jgi:hypothetical protein
MLNEDEDEGLPVPEKVTTPAEWARRLKVPDWKANAARAVRGWHPWDEIAEADYRTALETIDNITMQ